MKRYITILIVALVVVAGVAAAAPAGACGSGVWPCYDPSSTGK